MLEEKLKSVFVIVIVTMVIAIESVNHLDFGRCYLMIRALQGMMQLIASCSTITAVMMMTAKQPYYPLQRSVALAVAAATTSAIEKGFTDSIEQNLVIACIIKTIIITAAKELKSHLALQVSAITITAKIAEGFIVIVVVLLVVVKVIIIIDVKLTIVKKVAVITTTVMANLVQKATVIANSIITPITVVVIVLLIAATAFRVSVVERQGIIEVLRFLFKLQYPRLPMLELDFIVPFIIITRAFELEWAIHKADWIVTKMP